MPLSLHHIIREQSETTAATGPKADRCDNGIHSFPRVCSSLTPSARALRRDHGGSPYLKFSHSVRLIDRTFGAPANDVAHVLCSLTRATL
jgi:hypothetical protein